MTADVKPPLAIGLGARCENCVYWQSFTADSDDGHCYRYPPVQDNRVAGLEGPVIKFILPVTSYEDFCGEWQAR